MTSERLALIREAVRQDAPLVALLGGRGVYLAQLLTHVDHLTAENARLRAGIERVRGHVHESWLHQGDVGLIEDALDDCDALLDPPTEGETESHEQS